MTTSDRLISDTESNTGGWSYTTTTHTALSDERSSLKVGTAGDHEVMCDEPAAYGGEGTAPAPLGYFGLAAGWCILTQLLRYAEMKKVLVENATCDVEIDWGLTGSVGRGDIEAHCRAVRYHIHVDSPADRAEVDAVVVLARQGCFIEAALRNPVSAEVTLSLDPGAGASLGREGPR